MIIKKDITKDNELCVYMNGQLIYKKWLSNGSSKVFDVMAYDKYTYASYTDIEMGNTDSLIYVRALLKTKSTEDGGRQTGFANGYRPNHVFEYENGQLVNTYIGDIQFEHAELFMPNEEHEVTVRFLLNQRIEKFLDVGRIWWIHEGPRIIAEAKIIEVKPPQTK